MITTTLNTERQTKCLGSSTHAYDAGELESLLDESGSDQRRDAPGPQRLSSELLAQILASDADSPDANGV